MLRIALYHIAPQVVLKSRIISIQLLGNLIFAQQAFFLNPCRNTAQQVVLLQEKPQQGKAFFGERKKVKLFVLYGIVYKEPQLLKVAGNDIHTFGLIVFVVKSLVVYLTEVFGVGALQFNNRNRRPIGTQYRPIGFLGILNVFELRGEVVTRIGIHDIPKNVNKQLHQEFLLKLLFLCVADVVLYFLVEEVSGVFLIGGRDLIGVLSG